MDKGFGGVVWTNHAIKRLTERGISQSDAWATWSRPDSSRYAASRGAWIYYRKFGNQTVEVVAKKDAAGRWIILSVWSRPSGKTEKTESFWLFLVRKLLKSKK